MLVKKNAATILREASRVIKEEEKEIEKVNQLVCGGVLFRYEDLAEEIREQEQRVALQDLQRKHLQGLLTHEQAILARHQLLENNKAKRAKMEEEKKETDKMIEEIKKRHYEQLKEMIKKTQQTQKNITDKKECMKQEKHKNAQELAGSNKQLYEKAMLKKKDDLDKRIQIIKEIKLLSSLKEHQRNNFDPTETMNIGLMGEMSIAELQERLLINKIALTEEINKRQACIRKQKIRQQEFLTETEKFIETCRQQKKQIQDLAQPKEKTAHLSLVNNQDIQKLKTKLQKARQKRLQINQIDKQEISVKM